MKTLEQLRHDVEELDKALAKGDRKLRRMYEDKKNKKLAMIEQLTGGYEKAKESWLTCVLDGKKGFSLAVTMGENNDGGGVKMCGIISSSFIEDGAIPTKEKFMEVVGELVFDAFNKISEDVKNLPVAKPVEEKKVNTEQQDDPSEEPDQGGDVAETADPEVEKAPEGEEEKGDEPKEEKAKEEFVCSICGKVCASKIGLASHMRACKKKNG